MTKLLDSNFGKLLAGLKSEANIQDTNLRITGSKSVLRYCFQAA